MIKTLLDADENPPPNTKVIIEETIVELPTTPPKQQQRQEQNEEASAILEIPSTVETRQIAAVDEVSEKPIDGANFQIDFKPETQAETMRKSGLAYAAAITLFGAVVFMMILGWGADLLLGTKPWGIVGGIVVGAIIGFVQFFRLTSQIIKNKE